MLSKYIIKDKFSMKISFQIFISNKKQPVNLSIQSFISYDGSQAVEM